MSICSQNLLHAQELQKQTYKKRVKSKNYASGKKFLLNSKIKTKSEIQSQVFWYFPSFTSTEKIGLKTKAPYLMRNS